MFTGLIEEKGKILNTPQGEAGSFSIVAGDILNDVEIGDSIRSRGSATALRTPSKNKRPSFLHGKTDRGGTFPRIRAAKKARHE